MQNLFEKAQSIFDDNPMETANLLKKAINIGQRIGDEKLLAKVYLEYAQICYALNESHDEIEYALKARELYTKLKDRKGISTSLVRLARAKLNSMQYDDVLQYLTDAKKIAFELNDSNHTAYVYSHLGAAFNWMKSDNSITDPTERRKKYIQYSDSAIYYVTKCIEIQTKLKHPALAVNYNNLGINLYDRAIVTNKDFSKALEAHRMALKLKTEQKNHKGIASSYQEIGKIYFQQKKIQEGLALIKRSIEIADSLDYTPHLEDAYSDLYKFYFQLGEKDSAYKFQAKHFSVAFKRLNKKNALMLTDMEKKYNNKQKETELLLKTNEIKAKQAQLKLQTGITIVSAVGILILAFFSIFYYSLYKKNRVLNQKNTLLLKEQNHRVKNNLQVISALLSLQANRIENIDAKKAIEDSQLRVQAMGMIHKKLYGDNVVEIDMKTFIPELSECILPVFGFQNGSVQHFIETTIENLNVDKAVPVGLILNELLTNSCKYAFPKTGMPFFKISMLKNPDNSISLTYQDNGPGFDHEPAIKKGSFGLKLIELQSRQIFGEYRWENKEGTFFFVNWKN
jgi:two-component sensor histidine kinase